VRRSKRRAAVARLETDLALEREALKRVESQVRDAAKLVIQEEAEALAVELDAILREQVFPLRDALAAVGELHIRLPHHTSWAEGRMDLPQFVITRINAPLDERLVSPLDVLPAVLQREKDSLVGRWQKFFQSLEKNADAVR
jgi:hypothetical protein